MPLSPPMCLLAVAAAAVVAAAAAVVAAFSWGPRKKGQDEGARCEFGPPNGQGRKKQAKFTAQARPCRHPAAGSPAAA